MNISLCSGCFWWPLCYISKYIWRNWKMYGRFKNKKQRDNLMRVKCFGPILGVSAIILVIVICVIHANKLSQVQHPQNRQSECISFCNTNLERVIKLPLVSKRLNYTANCSEQHGDDCLSFALRSADGNMDNYHVALGFCFGEKYSECIWKSRLTSYLACVSECTRGGFKTIIIK